MALIPTTRSFPDTAFPAALVESRLRHAITQLGQDIAVMKEPWEPMFDSLAVVNIIFVVEPVLPGVKIAPEKVVRKGGYATVDDAVRDITERLRRQYARNR